MSVDRPAPIHEAREEDRDLTVKPTGYSASSLGAPPVDMIHFNWSTGAHDPNAEVELGGTVIVSSTGGTTELKDTGGGWPFVSPSPIKVAAGTSKSLPVIYAIGVYRVQALHEEHGSDTQTAEIEIDPPVHPQKAYPGGPANVFVPEMMEKLQDVLYGTFERIEKSLESLADGPSDKFFPRGIDRIHLKVAAQGVELELDLEGPETGDDEEDED